MNFAKTYYADFSKLLSEENRAPFMNTLSDERKARVENAKREETKASLMASELLLREVLRANYGITELNLKTNEYGKPYLADRDDLHFNVSHSGTKVVCTVSNVECGVDIEKVDAPHDIMGVANKFFSTPEYSAMHLSPNPKEAFCRLWTLRESYVKMRGKGFNIGLSTLRCDFHRGVCTLYEGGILQADAKFRELKNVIGYRLSVCTKGECEHEIFEAKM